MAGISLPALGLLGAQARAQYAAMISLRWRIFVNGLRSKMGAFEFGARTVMFAIYASLGLAMGAGAGSLAYLLASEAEWQYLPILLWGMFVLWQMVPVMLASFQEQFDLGILLRFPVSFGSYYLLYVAFGLADVSTILGGLCCLGIWVGMTAARPDLFAWTALALGVFAAFNILLVRAVFAWIDRWLAQRKTREILGAVFMLLMLGLQLFNPALHQNRHPRPVNREQALQQARDYQRTKAEFKARYQPWLERTDAVQRWLPPGLAAQSLERAGTEQPASAFASMGLLGLYMLTVGGALAGRLRAEYRGENLGQAPKLDNAAPKRTSLARREGGGLVAGSGPVAAVIEKEVRGLLRSLPLLYAVGAPLVLVVVFSTVFLKGGSSDGRVFPLALPACMVYAQLGFTQLFYNNLGAEGAGIQLYFLSPTPIRLVLLAKNLFHAVLFGLVALTAGVLTSLRLGAPGWATVAATAAWLLFTLPCNLAAGNIFSLTMPFRMNPGRMSRQRGSQASSLFSLLVQLGVLAVGAAVFGLCWYLEKIWLAVPVFLTLAVAAVYVWMHMLRNADAMANQRKDTLLAALMKAE